MKVLPDNNTIIAALAEGDEQLFGQLYDYYSQALFRNIYKLLPDTQEAEDVLQTVFLKLWEQRHSLNSKQSVAGWLFTTSFYMTMTCVRKKVKTRMQALAETSLEVKQEEWEHDDRYEKKTAFLREAIDSLPERKRLAFELYKIQGKSYKEVAETLGIKEETVKEYVKSALQMLRQMAAKSDVALYTLFVFFIA
ncbi:sigma-70 family RNA polymerase sigma factor [Chitinophaga horti]|uniref:Sigma-70 family RNA polymerase sigma factor n=1 Tax=Chitinophaga horti TaxID=2920382 RepID=A0ABY6J9N2_9BACT|nr:sigma-70 family RNA polymerase sigma factor [Chitinophaga horti]UYQ95006.1 sigma-70 family RNA polymerase sigma factor [Chitinophaga horti]